MAARADVSFPMDPSWLPALRRHIRQALRAPEEVEKLNLSNVFGDALPDFFDRFPHLKTLSIGSSGAKALPPTLRSARALENVVLTECRGLEEIDLLWDLPAIRGVTALHCPALRSVGDGIACARTLTSLHLSTTSLVSLPQAIAELPELTSIGINTTFALDLRALWPVLAACPALETIDLRGSRLRGTPEKLARPPKLKVLHVGSYGSFRCELPDGILGRLRETLDDVAILTGNEPLPRPAKPAGNASAKASAKTAARTTPKSAAMASGKSGARAPKPIAGIPITREEIEPLFGDEMPRHGYGFSCSFRSKLGLEAMRDVIAGRLGELRAARKVTLHAYPPPDGPSLYVEYAGKQVGTQIRGAKDDPSRWLISAVYRGEGAPWGSNHALFLWMKATILPWLGATDVR